MNEILFNNKKNKLHAAWMNSKNCEKAKKKYYVMYNSICMTF